MSAQEEENLESKNITDSMVSEYLRETPDFFTKHADILAELTILHDRGSAI